MKNEAEQRAALAEAQRLAGSRPLEDHVLFNPQPLQGLTSRLVSLNREVGPINEANMHAVVAQTAAAVDTYIKDHGLEITDPIQVRLTVEVSAYCREPEEPDPAPYCSSCSGVHRG